MKKPRKPKHFYSDLYMVNFYFYEAFSPKETVASMSRYLNAGVDESRFQQCHGKAFQLNDGDVVIWIKGKVKNDLAAFAHECLHVANMVLKSKGVMPCYENDEAQAYLLGWIVRRCAHGKT